MLKSIKNIVSIVIVISLVAVSANAGPKADCSRFTLPEGTYNAYIVDQDIEVALTCPVYPDEYDNESKLRFTPDSSIKVKAYGKVYSFDNVIVHTDGAGNDTYQAYKWLEYEGIIEVISLTYEHEGGYLSGYVSMRLLYEHKKDGDFKIVKKYFGFNEGNNFVKQAHCGDFVRKVNYITHNEGTIDAVGTHKVGEMKINYSYLFTMFGYPIVHKDDRNVDVEWKIRFNDGTVATIYNWQNGHNYCKDLSRGCDPSGGYKPEDMTIWHIGGKDSSVLYKINKVIKGLGRR